MPTLIERIKSLFGRGGGNDKPQEGKMYYYKLGTIKFPDFTQRMMEDYFDAGKLDAKGNTAWKEEHPSRTDIPDFPAKEKPEDMSVSGGKFVFEDSFWHPDRNDIHPDMRPVGTFGGLTFVDREAGQVYVSDTHRVDVYQNVSEEEVKAVLRGYNKTHNIRLDSMDAPLHDITVAMLESGELKPEAVEKAVKTHKAASGAKSRAALPTPLEGYTEGANWADSHEKTASVSPGSKGRWHQDAQNEQREAVAEGHDPAAVLSAHDSEEPEAAEEKVETDTAREQARKEEHTERRSGGLHM